MGSFCRTISILTTRSIPNPRKYGGWVTDKAHILSINEISAINKRLEALNDDFGVEFAVVTATGLIRLIPPKQHALWLFNRWGIGDSEVQNGLLMLLLPDIRRLEMITGDGIALHLTDAWLAQMQAHTMVPHLKAGQFGVAIEDGVEAVDRKLRGLVPPDFDVQSARRQHDILARRRIQTPSIVSTKADVDVSASNIENDQTNGATVLESTPSLPTFIAPLRSEVTTSTESVQTYTSGAGEPPQLPPSDKKGKSFSGGETHGYDRAFIGTAVIAIGSVILTLDNGLLTGARRGIVWYLQHL